jgi:hypothetical protein
MEVHDKRLLIERYIYAYNAFDIDGMMSVLHPDIGFKNVSGGAINATASGSTKFRELAEQSRELFSIRKQTITGFETKEEQAVTGIDFEGVLAADLPNGMKAGETLRLHGRSEFVFRDGLIYRITDIS